jgi:hypothetical protein
LKIFFQIFAACSSYYIIHSFQRRTISKQRGSKTRNWFIPPLPLQQKHQNLFFSEKKLRRWHGSSDPKKYVNVVEKKQREKTYNKRRNFEASA